MNFERALLCMRAILLIACVTFGGCSSQNHQLAHTSRLGSNERRDPAATIASDVRGSNSVEGIDAVVVAFIGAIRDETYRLVLGMLEEHGISAAFDGSIVYAVYVPRWQSAEATRLLRLLKEDKRLADDRIKFPAVIK